MDTLNSVQLPIPFSTRINKWSEASENTDQGFNKNKTKNPKPKYPKSKKTTTTKTNNKNKTIHLCTQFVSWNSALQTAFKQSLHSTSRYSKLSAISSLFSFFSFTIY